MNDGNILKWYSFAIGFCFDAHRREWPFRISVEESYPLIEMIILVPIDMFMHTIDPPFKLDQDMLQ